MILVQLLRHHHWQRPAACGDLHLTWAANTPSCSFGSCGAAATAAWYKAVTSGMRPARKYTSRSVCSTCSSVGASFRTSSHSCKHWTSDVEPRRTCIGIGFNLGSLLLRRPVRNVALYAGSMACMITTSASGVRPPLSSACALSARSSWLPRYLDSAAFTSLMAPCSADQPVGCCLSNRACRAPCMHPSSGSCHGQ